MPATASSALPWTRRAHRPSACSDVLQHDGQALADADADGGDAPALAALDAAPWPGCRGCDRPRRPSGWPIAMAPPLVLTISGSMPHASTQASDCTAKASFSSTAPTSRPADPGPSQRQLGGLHRRVAEHLRLQRSAPRAGDPGDRVEADPARPPRPSRAGPPRRRR